MLRCGYTRSKGSKERALFWLMRPCRALLVYRREVHGLRRDQRWATCSMVTWIGEAPLLPTCDRRVSILLFRERVVAIPLENLVRSLVFREVRWETGHSYERS